MYSLIRFFATCIFKIIFRWRITGAENVPASGAVIVASNHISNFDPLVVGAAITRPIHFMAKEELFANPVLRQIIRWLGAFPVRRGAADRTAIRTAMNFLEEGKVIGLFPEGTRSKTGEIGQAEAGLAMIATKTGATIVPAAIFGTNKVFQAGSLLPGFQVYFGKPIRVKKGKASKKELENITETMMQEIRSLLKEQS